MYEAVTRGQGFCIYTYHHKQLKLELDTLAFARHRAIFKVVNTVAYIFFK